MESTLASGLPTRRTSLPALIRRTTGLHVQAEAGRFLLDLKMTTLECDLEGPQLAASRQIVNSPSSTRSSRSQFVNCRRSQTDA
jgi:hypothetical protein